MLLWIVVTGNQFSKNFHLHQTQKVSHLWRHMWPISTEPYQQGRMSPQHFKGCPIGFGEASAWGGAARPSSQPMTHCKSAPTAAAWRHWSSLLKGRVHGFCQGLRENRILFQPTQALKRMKNLQISPQSSQSEQLPSHQAPSLTLPSGSSQPLKLTLSFCLLTHLGIKGLNGLLIIFPPNTEFQCIIAFWGKLIFEKN